MGRRYIVFILISFIIISSGCAVVLQKGRRTDIEKIQSLEDELAELRNTKRVLEERLSKELADKEVRLKMEDRGLVITFVAEVLFDSGKADLRKESFPILNKVVRILKEEAAKNDIGIEGHTDNEPIKYSKWKSNWELSAHRALSVLEYLVSKGINPKRLSATGYGEYRPVAPNDTPEHKQLNRRVEIVIIPQKIKKKKEEVVSSPIEKEVYEKELK